MFKISKYWDTKLPLSQNMRTVCLHRFSMLTGHPDRLDTIKTRFFDFVGPAKPAQSTRKKGKTNWFFGDRVFELVQCLGGNEWNALLHCDKPAWQQNQNKWCQTKLQLICFGWRALLQRLGAGTVIHELSQSFIDWLAAPLTRDTPKRVSYRTM